MSAIENDPLYQSAPTPDAGQLKHHCQPEGPDAGEPVEVCNPICSRCSRDIMFASQRCTDNSLCQPKVRDAGEPKIDEPADRLRDVMQEFWEKADAGEQEAQPEVEAKFDPRYLVLVPRNVTTQLLSPWREGTIEYGMAKVMWGMYIAAWDKSQQEAIDLHEMLAALAAPQAAVPESQAQPTTQELPPLKIQCGCCGDTGIYADHACSFCMPFYLKEREAQLAAARAELEIANSLYADTKILMADLREQLAEANSDKQVALDLIKGQATELADANKEIEEMTVAIHRLARYTNLEGMSRQVAADAQHAHDYALAKAPLNK